MLLVILVSLSTLVVQGHGHEIKPDVAVHDSSQNKHLTENLSSEKGGGYEIVPSTNSKEGEMPLQQPPDDFCTGNIEYDVVCAVCTKHNHEITIDMCCSTKDIFASCRDNIALSIIEKRNRGLEEQTYQDLLADEKEKRYGNLFSNWGGSNAFRKVNPNGGPSITKLSKFNKDKRENLEPVQNVFAVPDMGREGKEKRYGSTFNRWNWNNFGKLNNLKQKADKRYGSTFNTWNWEKLGKRSDDINKRYGNTFSEWNWDKIGKRSRDVAKRYSSTFNSWNWDKLGKRSSDVDKRYGSTFNTWDWDKLGKRDSDIDKRYGSTFSSWNWDALGKRWNDQQDHSGYNQWRWYKVGKKGADKVKRYGSTFNNWNWDKIGKRNDDKEKRYGSTFNKWSWDKIGKRNSNDVDKRYGNTFHNWDWSKLGKRSEIEQSEHAKRYGSTFNKWN